MNRRGFFRGVLGALAALTGLGGRRPVRPDLVWLREPIRNCWGPVAPVSGLMQYVPLTYRYRWQSFVPRDPSVGVASVPTMVCEAVDSAGTVVHTWPAETLAELLARYPAGSTLRYSPPDAAEAL